MGRGQRLTSIRDIKVLKLSSTIGVEPLIERIQELYEGVNTKLFGNRLLFESWDDYLNRLESKALVGEVLESIAKGSSREEPMVID
jgi:hypothetical protein